MTDKSLVYFQSAEGAIVALIAIAAIMAARYLVLSYFFYVLIYRVAPRFLVRRLVLNQPMRQDVTHDIRNSILTNVTYTIVAWICFLLAVHDYAHVYFDVTAYGWLYLVLSVPLMMLLHDTYFYWAHYLLHSPVLFRRVHYVHHVSKNPTPVASHSFHPLEGVAEAGVYPLAVFTIPMHPYALAAFFALMFVIVSYGHSGLELMNRRFAMRRWTGWMATATHHTLHHRTGKYNLGLYFTIWDRIVGTEAPNYIASIRPPLAAERTVRHA